MKKLLCLIITFAALAFHAFAQQTATTPPIAVPQYTITPEGIAVRTTPAPLDPAAIAQIAATVQAQLAQASAVPVPPTIQAAVNNPQQVSDLVKGWCAALTVIIGALTPVVYAAFQKIQALKEHVDTQHDQNAARVDRVEARQGVQDQTIATVALNTPTPVSPSGPAPVIPASPILTPKA